MARAKLMTDLNTDKHPGKTQTQRFKAVRLKNSFATYKNLKQKLLELPVYIACSW